QNEAGLGLVTLTIFRFRGSLAGEWQSGYKLRPNMFAEHRDGFSFSLASLEALWRHTSDLILEYDSRFQLISANPAAQSFIQNDLLKKTIFGKTNLDIFGPEVGAQFDRAFIAVKTQKKP